MSQFQHFDIRHLNDCTEVYLADTTYFDVPQLAELQHELLGFVGMYRPKKLVVRFDRIRYCSTALISGVLQARQKVHEVGGELKMCGMAEPVRQAFSMLNLDGPVFDIYQLESDAIAAF